MINTSQQVGGRLGTALMNTVAVTATSAYLVANAAQGEAAMPAALTEGFTRGFYVGAGLLLTAAVVVFFMIRIGARRRCRRGRGGPGSHRVRAAAYSR
jgi:hypothetical protein